LPGDLRPQVGHASGSPAFGGPLAVGFGGAGAAGLGGAGFGALAVGTGGLGALGGTAGAGFGGAGAEYTSSRSSTDFVAARAGGGGDIGIGSPSS
jgi:general secretion pathway protein D